MNRAKDTIWVDIIDKCNYLGICPRKTLEELGVEGFIHKFRRIINNIKWFYPKLTDRIIKNVILDRFK